MMSSREDKAMNYAFYTEPSFLEKCLTCEFMDVDKDVGDQLCCADKDNVVPCQQVEIEMLIEKINACIMRKEIK